MSPVAGPHFFLIDKVWSSLPDRTQEELSTDQYRSVCVFVIVEVFISDSYKQQDPFAQ